MIRRTFSGAGRRAWAAAAAERRTTDGGQWPPVRVLWRTSTEGFQDPESSRAWQREVAESVIAGHGEIAEEFADVGWSREVAWERRPRAAALLAAARSPGRRFDAVVVGEYERGFTARQFLRVAEQLDRHGVRVWLPEADGPVDPADPTHRALVTALGAIAQREVSRSRHRTLAAMRAQTLEQGRFQGGRPPYGYRLVDAGPHPNRAQAAWGKRLQRLDPEPVTAAHVRWMFARRLEACSLAGIARELNERGVRCPSMDDPDRNRNRSGGMRSVPTVGAILANPRYTGRAVWNRRQATDRNSRSTIVGESVVSRAVTHPALVSEADFVAAQQVRAERATRDGGRRRYLFRWLLRCGHCGRGMDSHWVHERAEYRCRHGLRSTTSRPANAPDNLYVREDAMLRGLADRITLDDDDAAGSTSKQDALKFLRSNAMVVEVYGPTRWAVTTRD